MNNLQANICLLAVTICWSCEVVLLSALPEGVNPFATTCATSLIGAILLNLCFARRIIAAFRKDGAKLVRRVIILSLLNASFNVLIEAGLEHYDVSSGAFALTMTAVVLPVMLLIMRRGVSARTWLSAAMVFFGVVIATLPVFHTIHPRGFAVMISSCVIRAIYIVKLSDFAREHDPIALAAGISVVNALITFVPWCAMDPLTFTSLPWSSSLIAVFVIYSYFIVAYSTVMNIFAQRRATPAQATIIYATEIIFSIIWATCLPDFVLVDQVGITPYMIAGCAFIVLGNLTEVFPVKEIKYWISNRRMRRMLGTADSPETNEGDADSGVDQEDAPNDSLGESPTIDIVSRILRSIKRPVVRGVALFLILLAVDLVISLPFKALSVIPGFSDIRPVCMLQPVYGIFFGLPGCFAFAIGNVIGDIASDSLRWTSIAGFIGNFAFPFLMYLYWTKLRRKPFHLRTRRMILDMVGSILFCSLIETLIICPAVALVYPEVDIVLFTASVIGNTSLFSICFAIPFMILIQEELGFIPLGRKLPKT